MGGCSGIAPSFFFLLDRKSTRLNSSHLVISYAVFCLKKKKIFASFSASRSSLCFLGLLRLISLSLRNFLHRLSPYMSTHVKSPESHLNQVRSDLIFSS